MNSSDELKNTITKLFGEQKLAVLATQYENQPYTSLVAFVSDSSLLNIVFATDRNTRKFQYLKANPGVSVLIHSGSNHESDFTDAIAVTAVGTASETEGTKQYDCQRSFILKHPYLSDFVRSPSVALVEIQVHSYYIVEKFQQVVEFKP